MQTTRATDRTDWPSKTTIHTLLSADRRCSVLDILDSAGPMGVADLADRVSAREGTVAADVTTALYHHHLPVLEEHGVITRQDDRVRLGSNAAVVLRVYRAGQRARVQSSA